MEKRRIVVSTLVVAAILCAATACFLVIKSRPLQEQEPKQKIQEKEKQIPNQSESQIPTPTQTKEQSRTDQSIAAIKRDELRIAETLIKDFPSIEEPLVIMGDVKHMHGDANEAMNFFKEALKINPMRPDVHNTMSEIYAKRGNFVETIAHLRKFADIQPHTPNVHGRIGELYMKLNELDKAIDSFEKEIQIQPGANSYFSVGQAYVIKNETEKAGQYYKEAIKIDPNHSKAHYGLATVCAKLRQLDEAKVHFEICRKLKTQARKELKAARTMHDDTIQTRKNAAVNYIRTAKVYRNQGRLGKAEALFLQAAELDPKNVGGLLELASLYRQNNRHSEVSEIHAKIARLELKHADNCIIFGNLSAELQLLDQAEKAYRRATELDPKRSLPYRKLAQLYLNTKKQLPEARRLAEKAADLENLAVNYFVLSKACLANADGAGAMKAIEQALELEPRNREYQHIHDLVRRMGLR